MNTYPDTAAFYAVMEDLFGQVIARPDLLKPLQAGKTALRIIVSAPDGVLLLDARRNPPQFTTGPGPDGTADITLRLAADTLHAVWLGRVRLRDEYLAGKIVVDGNPLKAMAALMNLADLFRFVEDRYPDALRRAGLAGNGGPAPGAR